MLPQGSVSWPSFQTTVWDDERTAGRDCCFAMTGAGQGPVRDRRLAAEMDDEQERVRRCSWNACRRSALTDSDAQAEPRRPDDWQDRFRRGRVDATQALAVCRGNGDLAV